APERRVVVCQEADVLAALEARESAHVFTGRVRAQAPRLVFVFPGGGSQQVAMGRELHAQVPVFRAALDLCAEQFARELGEDIRTLMFPAAEEAEAAARQLLRPSRNMAAI